MKLYRKYIYGNNDFFKVCSEYKRKEIKFIIDVILCEVRLEMIQKIIKVEFKFFIWLL